jgi:RNA polymerase sigma-70 factor (ECF subfamily)
MDDHSTSISLLQRVRQRDPSSWERLVFLYSPMVDHWCRRWGAHGADLDDLRQEVFQSVAAGLSSFRDDRPGDSFRSWLKVIARRRWLDFCRARKRQPQAAGGPEGERLLEQVADTLLEEIDPPELVRQLYHRALELSSRS